MDKYKHGKYEEAKKLGYEKETVRNYGWVSGKIKTVNRVTDLSWKHHQIVAKYPPEEQKEWLNNLTFAVDRTFFY